MRRRTIGLVLIAIGLVGLLGSAWVAATSGNDHFGRARGAFNGTRETWTCTPPALPGQTVDVILSDMGGGMIGGGMIGGGMIGGGMMGGDMMGGGRMMGVSATPSTVAAADVSFRVWNQSFMMVHELVVMPLGQGTVGARPIGSDGQVSEDGSLGEASNACVEGAGEGIPPGSASWVTLRLCPGRYELMCNLPGHYARAMYTELDVTS